MSEDHKYCTVELNDNAEKRFIEKELKDIRSSVKYTSGYPLAMFAFGMSTLCVGISSARNSSNPDLSGLDCLLLSQGFLFGGLCQTIAGIFAYLNNEPIGMFLCMMFSGWWYTFCITNLELFTTVESPSSTYLVFFFRFTWTIFLILNSSFIISKIKDDVVSALTLSLITLASLIIAIAVFFGNSEQESLYFVGGLVTAFAGLCAIYVASSHLLKDVFNGKEIFPISCKSYRKLASN